MKTFLFILTLFFPLLLFSQRNTDFSQIDGKVNSIEANTPDTLAYLLTEPYQKQVEKVRSIFKWITEHIAYKAINRYGNSETSEYVPGYTDSSFTGESIHETIAKRVLLKKYAVCDGYSRLFKTLCDYAGIKSEVITGYAKTNQGRGSSRFTSNHNWNAVYIDTSWYLLDVTWASGFIAYNSGEFIKHFNNYYFLTPPEEFILDHFPDDLQWTLLPKTPAVREFSSSPFKQKSFSKYTISSYSPSSGIINAVIGDTLHFVLETSDPWKDKRTNPDELFDTTMINRSSAWAFIYPGAESNQPSSAFRKKIKYEYVVQTDEVEWVHLMYNNDLIMRYKLNIKRY